MTNNKQIKELHCDGMGGWSCHGGGYGYFGGRSKLPIDAELAPVHGRTTVFSLPHACLATGLLQNPVKKQALQWSVLVELAKKQWKGSTERFLKDIEKAGVNETSIDKQASKHSGVVIGWTGPSVNDHIAFGVCADIDITLAVLSRRVGDIFISSRNPDYSWEKLFDSPFEVDEDFCVAPGLKSDPWSKFKWALC